MEFKEFPQLKEKLYYEQLENGLEVYMLPKPGFNKSFATFTTKYGSIDNHFIPIGQDEMKLVPDGIAFLHIVPRLMHLHRLQELVIYFHVRVI